MTMIRPKGKPYKIAQRIMRQHGGKVVKDQKPKKLDNLGPYLQH